MPRTRTRETCFSGEVRGEGIGVEAPEGGDNGEGREEERGSDQPSNTRRLLRGGGEAEESLLRAEHSHAPPALALHRRRDQRRERARGLAAAAVSLSPASGELRWRSARFKVQLRLWEPPRLNVICFLASCFYMNFSSKVIFLSSKWCFRIALLFFCYHLKFIRLGYINL